MKTTNVSLFFFILLICGIFEYKASSVDDKVLPVDDVALPVDDKTLPVDDKVSPPVDEANTPKVNNDAKSESKINKVFKNGRNKKIAAIAASIVGSTLAFALTLACMNPEVRNKFRIRNRFKDFDDIGTPKDISLISPVENPYPEKYPEQLSEQYPEQSPEQYPDQAAEQYLEQYQKHYTKRFLEHYPEPYPKQMPTDHAYSYSPSDDGTFNTYYMAPDTQESYKNLFVDDSKEGIVDFIEYKDELNDLMSEAQQTYGMDEKPFDPYI
ncbi:up-regulated in infective sporozoites early transcribed membrane protein [Plasmodium vinckei lentum]|uniref:Up-regulated in infective sporozoites early transcribed membrane protein n=1 Tax=Plasmodium vinckei lentum TaxID=138297 RepID=A0A6V7RW26_PLAVN|nr:up-regulated in infective sporozoites early transcribed membrane protein [Plasmodium vinckei lentum]